MKLACFDAGDGARAGLVVDHRVFEIGPLLGVAGVVADIEAMLHLPFDAVDRLGEASVRPAEGGWPVDQVTLLPPILRPPTIRDHIAYEEHASRQFTRSIPDVWRRRPIHYYTNPSRLVGHNGVVTRPATERLDYELELAAVVADRCTDVPEAEAMKHILGFTVMNDWSARDLQADEMAYGLGPAKGKDFATSLGPVIVTSDELIPYLGDGVLGLKCAVRVNGETWADGCSDVQFHSWGSIVEHASQDSLLLPGDVLASGTVAGCSVGEAIRKGYAARYLVEGDRVELDVEHIGVLANTIGPPTRPREQVRYQAAELPPMPERLPVGDRYRVVAERSSIEGADAD